MTKQTDDLIKILSQSPLIQKPFSFGFAVLLLSGVSLAMTFTILGTLRPEIMALAPPVTFFIKTAILCGFAVTAFLYVKQAAKPVPSFPSLGVLLVMPIILAALVGWEWSQAASMREILSVLLLPNFKACLFFVSVYGLGGIVALTVLMKHYAPADENKAAGWIGFAAATACAVGYSFHCPVDSPTFIAVAYGLPVAALGLVARFIVPKFIRW
jgi:hypothetical protein